jgi:hypothetical protein
LREALAASGWLALAVVTGAACSREEPAAPQGGTIEAQWVGSDTGGLVAPAVAEWCDSLRMLELRAVHGDTGIALVLYPADSLAPGEYPVVAPQRADSTRPSAGVALRYFSETSIRGFRSDSGAVTLAGTGPGAASGRFTAHLRSATEGSRLELTGSYRGLSVRPAAQNCAGVAEDPDDPEPDLEEEFQETAD